MTVRLALTEKDSPVMINKITANFFQQLEESEPDFSLPLLAGSSYSPKSTIIVITEE